MEALDLFGGSGLRPIETHEIGRGARLRELVPVTAITFLSASQRIGKLREAGRCGAPLGARELYPVEAGPILHRRAFSCRYPSAFRELHRAVGPVRQSCIFWRSSRERGAQAGIRGEHWERAKEIGGGIKQRRQR